MIGCINELTSYDIFGRKPKYDMVLTLCGSEDSIGALTEKSVAHACGIPVYELAEVVDA